MSLHRNEIKTASPPDQELEETSVVELQARLSEFLTGALQDPANRAAAIETLHQIQQATLHLENPTTGEKRPINVSLLPIVISEAVEQGLNKYVAITNLVRAAVLIRLENDARLRSFFESGVDPLAVEIMRANPYTPQKAQWRFRADTVTDQISGHLGHIENNGGEPQGDAIIADAQAVVETVYSSLLGLTNQDSLSFGPKPDEQMMKVLIARHRLATGRTDIPTVGYLAWRGRSSLSHAEARYTAQRYDQKHGGGSVAFDPRDIVDIAEVRNGQHASYQIIVEQNGVQTPVDVIRRLHAEPFENMDLWREFKSTSESTMCSDGVDTIWARFTTKLLPQMVNPLNSWATDKKLDVILGNPDLQTHFSIWEEVSTILQDRELCRQMSVPTWLVNTPIADLKTAVESYVPRAYMLRRITDGLYPGDCTGKTLCLSQEQIDDIKNNRDNWVLKQYSLAGHSGTSVHVGRNPQLHELDLEDYLRLSDREIERLTGLDRDGLQDAWHNGVFRSDSIVGRSFTLKDTSKPLSDNAQIHIRSNIANNVSSIPEWERTQLQDSAWVALVENSLNKPDALVQAALGQQDVSVVIFQPPQDPDKPLERNLVATTLHWDLDPQSIAISACTYPVIRVTSASKTNITGGYGALGVPISEQMARNILKIAKAKGLLQ